MNTQTHIQLNQVYGTHNYKPLEVVIERGQGVWLWDVEGQKYLDMLAAYSAVNFGHSNRRFIDAAKIQLEKITLTSRAFYNDQIGPFCSELAQLTGFDMVLPMNSGAEAVESAIKIARKWGYQTKGVADNQAEIICFDNNFAGRTTTLLSFSSTHSYRQGFGPFTPGFKVVAYGDLAAVERAVTNNTVGILFEPIQGEGGVIIPAKGFIRGLRELCTQKNILLIADEIQTGLCRTGKLFACEHEEVKADLVTLGKSLGAGIVPISVVLGSKEVMQILTPGTHGSTFGGNPFACAIAREVIKFIAETKPHDYALEMGSYFIDCLNKIRAPYVTEIRGKGLMIGVDIDAKFGPANKVCKLLLQHGVLCKDTRDQTLRFAPPLVISKEELDWGVAKIAQVWGA